VDAMEAVEATEAIKPYRWLRRPHSQVATQVQHPRAWPSCEGLVGAGGMGWCF